MRYFKSAKQIIDRLENKQLPLTTIGMTFLGVVMLRNFLELFSDDMTIEPTVIIHYTLSYVALALGLILIFRFFTKQPIDTLVRVILPGFIITIIVPVLDLLISGGSGFDISYYAPGASRDLWVKFLTFFGPYEGQGATPGIKIEIILVMAGAFTYSYIKLGKIIKSIALALSIYVLIFIYSIIPFIIKGFINWFGVEFELTEIVLRNFYLLIIFGLGAWLSFIFRPSYFIAIVRDLRLLRVAHFIGLLLLGIATVSGISGQPLDFNQDALFMIILSIISILFAILFSIVVNNRVDRPIDQISNQHRPTVTGAIPDNVYRILGWLFFALAIVYAWGAGPGPGFFVLVFIGIFYIYSAPPFRLKRLPVVSKLLTALNSYLMGVWGYVILAGSSREALAALPRDVLIYFIIFYTLSINFIDIKDYAGDKKAGIKTLPTLLGLKNSRLLIGFFMFSSYVAAWIFFRFPGPLLYILPALGLAQFYLINKRRYQEWPIFTVYLLTLLIIWRYLE